MAALCLSPAELRAALLEVGRLRRLFRRRLFIEIGSSIGPNFHTSGIYELLAWGGSYCPAGRTLFALHPGTGTIYPCRALSGRPEWAIGRWDPERRVAGLDSEKNVLGRLSRDLSLLKDECSPSRCPYAPICRGGCRAAAAAFSGGDLLAGQRACTSRIIDELAG